MIYDEFFGIEESEQYAFYRVPKLLFSYFTGRNYIETGEFLEKICPFFGIRFIAINDGFDTDTVEASGQLSVSLSNIINDYYAKDISRKVSSALRSKMENGEFIGAWEKYGYLKDPNNKNS